MTPQEEALIESQTPARNSADAVLAEVALRQRTMGGDLAYCTPLFLRALVFAVMDVADAIREGNR